MILQQELGCNSCFSSPEQTRARGKTSVCPGAILPDFLCSPLIAPAPSSEPSLTPVGAKELLEALSSLLWQADHL